MEDAFEKNISAFYLLDYENYYLHFVVESETDEAYQRLLELKEKLHNNSKAKGVKILIAGITAGRSQKIHNLLCSCDNRPQDVEILAFADSDACPREDWLNHLVYPLRQNKSGAATGYRWFVPQSNNLATLVMSALNAKIAQLLGHSPFNQAWGGSMAIKVETFYRVGIDKIWQTALSDDLSLSAAVKKIRKKVVFVPECIVASYDKTTWKGLFEFAKRQFIITKVTSPGTWWFGLISSIFAIVGLWGGLTLASIYAAGGYDNRYRFFTVPAAFFIGQLTRSVMRQKMVTRFLRNESEKLKTAKWVDIGGNIIWSWILLYFIAASAIGNTITWRGVTYKLIGPTDTVILNKQEIKKKNNEK
jgi:cellulose synthase/poly-beta-1,6-N-acetylglucosamine synthase-like glycosyltransferase